MVRIAVIGLDTSHVPEFAKRLQSPDCESALRVEGAAMATCLRFTTPFQSDEGLNERQRMLESLGVAVTTDFDLAVRDCDAVAIMINDPSRHLEFFARCLGLGKPIFLDKPMADSIESGRAIYRLAQENGARVLCSSSLRFAPQLVAACDDVGTPVFATVYGPLGRAPAGSSIVWYGVHAFEMLQRALGRGARQVFARTDGAGVVAIVEYGDSRRGVVELSENTGLYGGCLRSVDRVASFQADVAEAYSEQLRAVVRFFQGCEAPLEIEDTLEVLALLDAAQRSVDVGRPARL